MPRVALFPTCLVDVMRPSVGFAAARLIAGCNKPPLVRMKGHTAVVNGDVTVIVIEA